MRKSLYELEIGESTFVGPIEHFRTTGGWLAFTVRGICFVPWNNEFQLKTKEAYDW
jgi:hypothetical protein